jgi:hypothetical protein
MTWHHAGVKKSSTPAKKPTPAAAKRKPVATKKRAITAKSKPVAAKKMAARADLGAPIDGFFARQPPHLRAILDELRGLVEEAAPEADSSIKWGMPFYTVGGRMMCALAGFKAHVNLILSGPPGAYVAPDGLLEGEGKTGRHLKIRALDDLPRDAVRGWLRVAATLARTNQKGLGPKTPSR